MLRSLGLFAVTAVAEIVGCYLPMLWLRKAAEAWVLIPAAMALAAFVWLLSLHPAASGRVYAAYGGVYVATALAWLWLVDGIRPPAMGPCRRRPHPHRRRRHRRRTPPLMNPRTCR